MKLSLAWIFDHINSDWRYHDIATLVQELNLTTAEIEQYQKVTLDLDTFTVASFQQAKGEQALVFSPELNKEFALPARADLVNQHYYLIKKDQGTYRWATLTDFHATKEGLLPALGIDKDQLNGSWKEEFQAEDYILHLENKSITHRPDLWGHRGFAREIATLLDLSLLPEDHFLVLKPIKHYENKSPYLPAQKISLEIKTPACKRLAALYIDTIYCPASTLPIMSRLAKIDARPLNFIVDATNYVMFDSGQPMHAFDAAVFEKHPMLIACMSTEGEKLTLLDGEVIALTHNDLVISNGEKVLSLAAIRGGKESSISSTTQSIVIEAGNFDAGTIRKTASHYKKRTESSARFEKNLDPNQNTQALLRFLKLLDDAKISYNASEAIISLGSLVTEQTIEISHDFIIKRLGMNVTPETIMHTLASIGFGIQNNKNGIYQVTVPTFRGSKETIKEDILEEIARLVGYSAIPQQLPQRSMKAFSINAVQRKRLIKHHCAYALDLHEVYNYSLFDEEFLHRLSWQPENALKLINPISLHWQRLVTSLIPHLLKNIYQNRGAHEEALQFFEIARTWQRSVDTVREEKKCAGIFFHQKSYDFYTGKAALSSLFQALSLFVVWQKPTVTLDPWFNPYQTAELIDENNHIIGYAGMLNTSFVPFLEGQGFIFELDADYLMEHMPSQKIYDPLPKYPPVYLDISMLVPSDLSVADMENAIVQTDMRIRDIQLLDFYQKEEWHNQRSITFRFKIIDDEKTLTKEEIDQIWDDIVKTVTAKGATVR